MYSLRIQKGRYRGKLIHSPVPVRGKSNATPSLLKEAVFQILEVRLGSERAEWAFFDVCAGSGQMAFEALSHGYGEVHICEIDRERFSSILAEVKRYEFPVILHRKDYIRLVPLISEKEKSVIYLDPPYSWWRDGTCDSITTFLAALDSACQAAYSEGRNPSGLICIQGQTPYRQDKQLKSITELFYRSYGNNGLTLLEYGRK